jgi:hypothetical protein
MSAPGAWPLVLVEWEDSHYLGVGWQDPTEFVDDTTICQSVGWLVLDGEKVKVLMPHRSVQDGALNQGGGIMQIPTRCVARMVRLGELTASSEASCLELGLKQMQQAGGHQRP